MQFSIGLIALFAASLAAASPMVGPPPPESPDHGGQKVNMEQHDSHRIEAVTVGDYNANLHFSARDLPARELFARAPVPNCKGSSLCSNGQSFKNQCQHAAESLQPTIYQAGGDKAGVCSGSCGLFVQGKRASNGGKCTATGNDLFNASQQILANGCQACGSVRAPAGGDCIITVNYVTGCGI